MQSISYLQKNWIAELKQMFTGYYRGIESFCAMLLISCSNDLIHFAVLLARNNNSHVSCLMIDYCSGKIDDVATFDLFFRKNPFKVN